MRAAVLLSAYNGEKYLEEQVNSILAQTFPEVELYLRDDGSSDGTPELLRRFAADSPRVHLVENSGGNLGYPACFYALTDLDIDADWFFFSDQDDVWLPEKIACAVKYLEKEDPEDIIAYYSRYYLCDEDLNVLRVSPAFPERRLSLRNTLYEVPGLEFTMAISRGAKRYLKEHKPVFSSARGTWMAMLFSAKGKIVFCSEPGAKYRRHGSAVTNSDTGAFGLWLWRIRKFFSGNGSEGYREILRDFFSVMRGELSEDDEKMLELFTGNRHLKKAVYPHRLRSRLTEEAALRLMFLLGKL